MIYGANRASSTLATAITNVATTIAINAGDAGKFPTPVGGGWFPLVIVDTSGNLEIVKCTARAAANLTVVRAQEGTAGLAFSAGSRVELRLTKGAFEGIQADAADSVSALTLIVASKADATALAAEAALARNAANLTGTMPDGVLPTRIGVFSKTTGDWNVVGENGSYMGAAAANAPDAGWWMGPHTAHNLLWGNQVVTDFTTATAADTRTMRRDKNNGTFGAWYKLQLSQVEQDARYAKLSGADFGGSITSAGSIIAVGSLRANNGAVHLNAAQTAYLWWNGTNYSTHLGVIATEAYVAAQIAANPSQLNQNLAHDAVGQYVFARANAPLGATTTITAGSTYAGSGLTVAGIWFQASGTSGLNWGGTLSGTWRALSTVSMLASGNNGHLLGLFVRIS